MKENEIKILIADDHPVFRRGLRSVIESESGILVVGEAENGAQALEMAVTLKPDLLILDVDMPLIDGIETARKITENGFPVKMTFLTLHKNIELLNFMRELNVHGYLLKDSALTEIMICIKEVMSGNTFISASVFETAIKEKDIAPTQIVTEPTDLIDVLTPAELRIIACIANGMTSREIGDHLFVSVRTVENHRFNIISKLYLRGNNALLRFALEHKDLILKSAK